MAWRWRLARRGGLGALGAALLLAPAALAQEAPPQRDAASTPDAPAPAAPGPKGKSPEVTPPRALDTPIKYPEGAEGEALVLLELLIEADGTVGHVAVISGEEPFASFGAAVAKKWRFTPALSGQTPRAARIRFEVRFSPPPEEPPTKEIETDKEESEPPAASDTTVTAKESTDVQEVIVTGERSEGAQELSRAEVRQMPGSFGDAFRAVENLPGVTPIVSGLPYFYVRGAPPGNVGYYLDGIRVPLLFHIAAGPSVIHPAFIDTVSLYAGPYPARYGRFTGGIVAGETAPPAYDHRGEVSIRLVDTGGMVETHAFDRKLSVMLGGRYSYTALIASLFAPDLNLSYWDYQGRIQYRINNQETVTLFAFGALDQASQKQPGPDLTIFDLIFHRYDLRYDKVFDDGAHFRAAALFGLEVSGLDVLALRDRLIGARLEYERPLSKTVELRSGIDVQTDRYTVRFDEDNDEDIDLGDVFPPRVDVVTGARADLVWEAEPGVRVIPGVRMDFYVANQTPLWAVDPRLYAEFDVRRNVTLKHGLGVAHQLPSFFLPLPGVQPVGEQGLQRSVQHSAGVEWRLPEGFSAEATVFQNMQINITDQASALRFEDNEDAFEIDARSQGSSRGFELMVRRSLTKRLGGYLSYTLSRSMRSFGNASGPSSFDRSHVLSSALGYQMGKGWIAGIRGSFYTGIPAQSLSSDHDFRYPPRTTPFYRVDWRLEKRWNIGEKGSFCSLVAEMVNTTLNKEMISLDCSAGTCRGERVGPVTIPSIGVEASF